MGQQKSVRQLAVAGMKVGLAIEHVEARGRQLAGLEGVDQRVVVDDGAARRVDDDRAVRQQGDALIVQKALGLGRRRAMQGKVIAVRQKVLDGDVIDRAGLLLGR